MAWADLRNSSDEEEDCSPLVASKALWKSMSPSTNLKTKWSLSAKDFAEDSIKL